MIDPRPDLRTLLPYARALVAPERAPRARDWSTVLADPRIGPVRLTGKLCESPGARTLLLVVHGLGGGTESQYCLRAARVASEHGLSSLRLALRGADRLGEDFYNVGLKEDLAAALASPELARYERVFLLGYSMGGYVVLHYVARHERWELDPRVACAATVCTPLDLAVAQRHVDTPRGWLYRRHVLGGLKAIYRAVAERGRPVPSPLRDVLAARTIYEWDRLVIAPRYGFESPEHFYAALALAPHVGRLAVPALLVASPSDPLIPVGSIRPFLPANGSGSSASMQLESRWVEGAGHVAFPSDLDLGFGPELGLEAQLLWWLEQSASSRHGRRAATLDC